MQIRCGGGGANYRNYYSSNLLGTATPLLKAVVQETMVKNRLMLVTELVVYKVQSTTAGWQACIELVVGPWWRRWY